MDIHDSLFSLAAFVVSLLCLSEIRDLRKELLPDGSKSCQGGKRKFIVFLVCAFLVIALFFITNILWHPSS